MRTFCATLLFFCVSAIPAAAQVQVRYRFSFAPTVGLVQPFTFEIVSNGFITPGTLSFTPFTFTDGVRVVTMNTGEAVNVGGKLGMFSFRGPTLVFFDFLLDYPLPTSAGTYQSASPAVTAIHGQIEGADARGIVTLEVTELHVVVIDAGHGQFLRDGVLRYQRDPSPTLGLIEDNINLAIANDLYGQLLPEQSVQAFMTRTTSTAPHAPPNCAIPCIPDLVWRRQFAEHLEADVLISIHANAAPSFIEHGSEVLYRYASNDSLEMSQALLNKVAAVSGRVFDGGVVQFNGAVLSEQMASALVEVAFFTNSILASDQIVTDEQQLNSDAYKYSAALAIHATILEFVASSLSQR